MIVIIIINNNTSRRAFILLKAFFLATISLDTHHLLGGGCGCSERLRDLPEATQLIRGRAGIGSEGHS